MVKPVKKREKIMGVRFYDDELADVEKRARKEGLDPSTWVRSLAVREARKGAKAK